MNRAEHDKMVEKGKGGYEHLWLILVRIQNKEADINDDEKREFDGLKEKSSEFFLREFQESLIEISKIAYNTGLYFILDRRIKELHRL